MATYAMDLVCRKLRGFLLAGLFFLLLGFVGPQKVLNGNNVGGGVLALYFPKRCFVRSGQGERVKFLILV